MPHLNGMGRVMLPCSLHMLRQQGEDIVMEMDVFYPSKHREKKRDKDNNKLAKRDTIIYLLRKGYVRYIHECARRNRGHDSLKGAIR